MRIVFPPDMVTAAFVSLVTIAVVFHAQVSLALILVPQVATDATVNNNLNRRIVGGTQASAQEAPFMARLSVIEGTEKGLCGGTILSDQVIITAAHCLTLNRTKTPINPTDIVIGIGAAFPSGLKQIQAIAVSIHPDYDPEKVHNDLGLVQVAKIDFSDSIQPVVISTDSVSKGTSFYAYGWGRTSNTNNDPSSALMKTTLKAADTKTCSKLNPLFDGGTMICMHNSQTPGNDTCSGDSGGPLVTLDGRLIGLTSYGENSEVAFSDDCAAPDGMSYYTHISSFLDFLSKDTGMPVGLQWHRCYTDCWDQYCFINIFNIRALLFVVSMWCCQLLFII